MEKPQTNLVKGFTLVTMFTLVTGAMVGMAWAVLTNVMLDRAGPAVIVSLLVGAILSLFIGLCFAELCSVMPFAGGGYLYVKRVLGPFPGFIAGWLLVLAYTAMMPGECIILGKLLNGLVPSVSPAVFGVIFAIVFTIVNLVGVQFSALVQLVLTVILFGGGFVYAIAAIPGIQVANLEPFFGRGVGGIFLMVPIAMLAFMGYDVLPQAAEEVNAPIKKLVLIIPAAIFFVAVFYIAVLVATAGLTPWEEIAKSTAEIPIMPSVVKALGSVGPMLIIIAGICGLVTTLNAFVIAGSRLMMGMAREGELPEYLAKLDSRFHVPYIGIIFIGTLGIIGSFVPQLIVLFDMASSAVLVTYLLVAITSMVHRRKEPNLERPYTMPAYPWIPIIAIIGAGLTWVMSQVILETWALIAFWVWALAGIGYYWVARRKVMTPTVSSP